MIRIEMGNTIINGCKSKEELYNVLSNAKLGIDSICRYLGKNLEAYDDLQNLDFMINRDMVSLERVIESNGKFSIMDSNDYVGYLKNLLTLSRDGKQISFINEILKDMESGLYNFDSRFNLVD